MNSSLSMSGVLTAKLIRAKKAPTGWRLRNALRYSFLKGWFYSKLAKGFSRLTEIPTITGELAIKLRKAGGEWIDYGIVSYRVVTDAGVAFLVDDWDDSTTDITNMHFHGCGTNNAAEAAADVALGAESTLILNPDSTRATGTETQPSANQLRTVGTLTFDGGGAIVEHGIFDQAATGGGTLWDRSIFAAINVVAGDSIQFTYTCTINSGG